MQRSEGQGSIEAQYEALTERVALVEGSDRGIIAGTGERPAAMLNGLVTNDLGPLESGRAVYALVLTPKGRPLAEVRIVPASTLWLDTPAVCLEPLLAHLGKYVPPHLASFNLTTGVERLSLVGPLASQALENALEALDAAPDGLTWTPRSADSDGGTSRPAGPLEVTELADRASGTTVFVVQREAIEGPGYDLYVPAGDLPRAREALASAALAVDGREVGPAAYEIWRVERGIPVFGLDFGPDNLPQETGLEERAISYEKGCYTGQEVVARIHYRGHVNRMLRGLALAESSEESSLEAGQALYREARAVGHITTAARSPRLGAIALGYVRREIEIDAQLSLEPGGRPLVQMRELPFTVS